MIQRRTDTAVPRTLKRNVRPAVDLLCCCFLFRLLLLLLLLFARRWARAGLGKFPLASQRPDFVRVRLHYYACLHTHTYHTKIPAVIEKSFILCVLIFGCMSGAAVHVLSITIPGKINQVDGQTVSSFCDFISFLCGHPIFGVSDGVYGGPLDALVIVYYVLCIILNKLTNE